MEKKQKEKSKKNTIEKLIRKLGYTEPMIEYDEIPKTLQKKITNDSLLFGLVAVASIYFGIKYDSSFIFFGLFVAVVGICLVRIGIVYPARRNKIKDVTGAIIKMEYDNIPLSKKESRIMNKLLYIEDEEKNVYRVKISEKKRKYEIGYICNFFVKKDLMRQSEGFIDCGTPLIIKITDMSI